MTGDKVRTLIDNVQAALTTNRNAQPIIQQWDSVFGNISIAMNGLSVPNDYTVAAAGVLSFEKSMRDGMDQQIVGILNIVKEHPIITNIVANLLLSPVKEGLSLNEFRDAKLHDFQSAMIANLTKYRGTVQDEDVLGKVKIALDVLQAPDSLIKRTIVGRMRARAVRLLNKPEESIDWNAITFDEWLRIIGIILSVLSILIMI
jgi:hypothetical protein